jgi:hypothetical protein
VKPQ